MKIKADRDIFRWGGWTYYTGPFNSDCTRAQTAADVLIKVKMPTCSKNAQAKPTELGQKGKKSLTSDSAISRIVRHFFHKNIKLARAIKKSTRSSGFLVPLARLASG